jgi:hypothetical protein
MTTRLSNVRSAKEKYELLCKFVVLARRMLMRIRQLRALIHGETLQTLKTAETALVNHTQPVPPCAP